MNYYLAPLEGITGYIYRNALHDYYGEHIDKYFIPFIEPHTKRDFNARELREISPNHNQGMHAVPQILTKSAEDFLTLEKALIEFGYDEINLNLGCPSKTVVAKGRGAGQLIDVPALDRFLDMVYCHAKSKVSIKTRIGMYDPEEFYEILKVYEKYPVHELIIHPRVQCEYYSGKPHTEIFQYAVKNSKLPLVYNGDITSSDHVATLTEELSIDSIMIGRGVLQNPNIFNELASQMHSAPDYKKIKEFHDRILKDYQEALDGDKNVLFKMKELWSFWGMQYDNPKKLLKEITKAQKVSDYKIAVNKLFMQISD